LNWDGHDNYLFRRLTHDAAKLSDFSDEIMRRARTSRATSLQREAMLLYNANCLRGEFYKPKNDNTKWEGLKFRGVHFVEAFVIRKRVDTLVGQSEPFQVVIQ
jgi:hypothetical protein